MSSLKQGIWTAGPELLLWAISTTDALYYLDDIDRDFERSHKAIAGHSRDTVDVSHARWATGTCITALDLCAAALGRALCGHAGPRELALADFRKNRKARYNWFTRLSDWVRGRPARQMPRTALPPLAREWIDETLADRRYRRLLGARHSLTHARIPRNLYLNSRVELKIGNDKVRVRVLVQDARDVATERVTKLIELLPKL